MGIPVVVRYLTSDVPLFLVQAGCFFGAILIYFFNELYGRRRSLLLAGSIFNIGVILQLCSAHRIGMLYAGRAFAGLGIGSSSLVIPQYISECAPASIRGGLVGVVSSD